MELLQIRRLSKLEAFLFCTPFPIRNLGSNLSGYKGQCYTARMITKAALLLFRDNQGKKELLFARAKGKSYYVFPGGKQEDSETIEEALQREFKRS